MQAFSHRDSAKTGRARVQLPIRAAIDGLGLTFLMEEHAAPYLAKVQLLRCSKTGPSRSPATSSTIRADASSRPRWQPSSTLFARRHSDSGRPCAGARLAHILIFLRRMIGSMFMRVNSKCAHHSRLCHGSREGRPGFTRQAHVCRRPGSTRQHIPVRA